MSRAAAQARRRFPSVRPLHGKVIRLDDDHPAVVEGRTLHSRLVRDPSPNDWVLKSGEHNRKLGSHVTKKRWKGFPIYSLSLEERATCPRTCLQWTTCYGNHVTRRGYRYRHGADLEQQLERELTILSEEPRTRRGFVIRLHALGDFYSPEYVDRWARWLDEFPGLRCFGYTAWAPDTGIGDAVLKLSEARWDRFAIRQSNGTGNYRTASVIPHGAPYPDPDEATVCPAETGGSDCCGTCGLCWTSDRRIAFVEH